VAFLRRYGDVPTPIQQTARPGMARGMFLDELRIAMGDVPPLGTVAGQARLRKAAPAPEVGRSESFGVHEADDLVLCAGIARKLEVEGRTMVILGIFSMTLVQVAEQEDERTVERPIAHQRRFLDRLLERNRDFQGGSASPLPTVPG
jgi:hypothetical protein